MRGLRYGCQYVNEHTKNRAETHLHSYLFEQLARARRLRETIRHKNRLYFFRYRPQNETYLVGFREYEQGQNADELHQFETLIDERELTIGQLRTPGEAHVYRLELLDD